MRWFGTNFPYVIVALILAILIANRLHGRWALRLRWFLIKLLGAIPALVLAWLILGLILVSRVHYWLTTDGQQAIAVITAEHQHNVVDYQYAVDGKKYKGTSQRNWENVKYRDVAVGGDSVVYYSASHPWLSSLETPCFPVRGTPVFLVLLPMELAAIAFAVSFKHNQHNAASTDTSVAIRD